MTRLELISELGKGRKEFRKLDFSNKDLSGLDLSNCDLRRSDFTNANLSNTILTNAILVVADLNGANLNGAIIDGVDWELVKNADKANFVGAIYAGKAIKKPATVGMVGKYQQLMTDAFIQIGCLKGDDKYWKDILADDAKLNAEVDKVNPVEKADAKSWKDANLSKTVSDHDKIKKP